MAIQLKNATGLASGKIILLGEHAVVYHQPAIAMPFKAVQTQVSITPASRGLYIHCALYNGLIDDMPELLTSLKAVIHASLLYLKQSKAALHINITSTIPIERGMGSSAAVAIATIRALFSFFSQPITEKELLTLVTISEKLVHGNPSGLDAATIGKEQALLFQKGKPMQLLPIHLDAYLIVADTGITGQTKKAIGAVAQLQQKNPKQHKQLVQELGHLVTMSVQALQQQQAEHLGVCLNHAHYCLQQLHVSHPSLDKLVATAQQNGALGAKMTGGGLGGCMIALSKTRAQAETIAQQLLANGATQTFIQDLNN